MEEHIQQAHETSGSERGTQREVRYSVVYHYEKTGKSKYFTTWQNPFEQFIIEKPDPLSPRPAIEIAVKAYGDDKTDSDGYADSFEEVGRDASSRPDDLDNPIISDSPFDSFRPTEVRMQEIRIHSKKLINFLRTFIRYYPSQDLSGDTITIQSPFCMLAHYYNELLAINDKKEFSSQVPIHEDDGQTQRPRFEEVTSVLDESTVYDLNILLSSFKDEYARVFAAAEARHAAGVVTFDLIWFLLKPGAKVYVKAGGKLLGYVLGSCKLKNERNAETGLSEDYWEVLAWTLNYNGEWIFREKMFFPIYEFDEDKKIDSLPLYPVAYLDSVDGGKTKTILQNVGEKCFNIIRGGPTHMRYEGASWDFYRNSAADFYRRKPDTEYVGEVILDLKPNILRRPLRSGELIVIDAEDAPSNDPDYTAPIYLDTKEPPFSFYLIDPKKHEHLTADHYFLLPKQWTGLPLKQKHRMGFEIEHLRPIEWPPRESDPMSSLILNDSDKDLLKALSRKYSKGQGPWSEGLVKGEWEGQIFLLHGPPGTGKTYTVECLAKCMRRPLLRLTVNDIGVSGIVVEESLIDWFQRAAEWGAIILIEDVEVFLSERQAWEFRTNTLVTVFCNCMENYPGMLFLTTSRIDHIDDAFFSRISVALTYEMPDSAKQTRIWQGLLEKLGEERKDIAFTDQAKTFLENLSINETTEEIPWSGREIRNAFQTVIALATSDAEHDADKTGEKPSSIMVKDEHFQAVVERRRRFISYRKSMQTKDEQARANSDEACATCSKKGQ